MSEWLRRPMAKVRPRPGEQLALPLRRDPVVELLVACTLTLALGSLSWDEAQALVAAAHEGRNE